MTYPYNLCHPFQCEHVWIWAGGDTSTLFPDDLLCSCGTIKYRDRNGLDKNIENAVLESELQEMEAQDATTD